MSPSAANTAETSGGGNFHLASLTLTSSTVSHNRAITRVSALSVSSLPPGLSLVISGSTIADNVVTRPPPPEQTFFGCGGGAVAVKDATAVTIGQTSFLRNKVMVLVVVMTMQCW
jgi:hypothetical protein